MKTKTKKFRSAAERIRARRKKVESKKSSPGSFNMAAAINKKASEIREPGEEWKSARARAKEMLLA